MCGCGSSNFDWEEELERIHREIEEADSNPDEAPIEVTEEFEKVKKEEEVEVDR